MNSQAGYSNTKVDKAMSPEQFTQVVEAILAGKYSWACLLLLRFAGYNPLHYIPYRTYIRLMKENCQLGGLGKHKTSSLNTSNHSSKSDRKSSQKCLSEFTDIAYIEAIAKQIR